MPQENVSNEEIKSLAQSIYTRYGIDFTCYEPKSLRRRIIRVMSLNNLTSIYELWVKFLRDSGFIQVFMNEISVGMTSMFRDPIFWIHLKKLMLSEFTSRKSISVWHTGCSTGEEVYSFGILLKELGMQEKTTALATDINMNAIEEAKNGVFHKTKMIENETNYREFSLRQDFTNYFIPDGKYVTMNPELITHATFQYHNLITDPFVQRFDIIFCRNVMIYFDSKAKLDLISKFHTALNPGGYLVIGFFDTINYLIDNKLFLLIDEEAKIFRKIDNKTL
jgi:chemotaxis protein methyltransferase CheR